VIEADDLIQRVGGSTWRRADVVAPAMFAAVAAPGAAGADGGPDWTASAEPSMPSLPAPAAARATAAMRTGGRGTWIAVGAGGGVLLLALVVVLILLLTRDDWERKSGRQLLTLCDRIGTDGKAGRLDAARQGLSELDALVTDRELEDPTLIDAVAKARESVRTAAAKAALADAKRLSEEAAGLDSSGRRQEALAKLIAAKQSLSAAAGGGQGNPELNARIDALYSRTKAEVDGDPAVQVHRRAESLARENVDVANVSTSAALRAIADGQLGQAKLELARASEAIDALGPSARWDLLRRQLGDARAKYREAVRIADQSSPAARRTVALRDDPDEAVKSFAECVRGNLELHPVKPDRPAWYEVESAEVIVKRAEQPDESGTRPLLQAVGTVICLCTYDLPARPKHRFLFMVEADVRTGNWEIRGFRFLDPNEKKGVYSDASSKDRSAEVEAHVRKWVERCPD
jgi:hypothetical protein